MPKSNTRKLNDTQLVILSSASQREDGFAVLPEGVRAASVKAAVIRLTKLGFLKQVRVKRNQPHWSSDEGGRRIGLKITNAGLAAIGVGDDGKGEEQPAPEPKRRGKKAAEPGEAQRETGAPHAGSKRAQIIALMQGVTGATLNDMVEVTGWLPHTTRAALTGLRHKGYAIAKSRNAEAKTVYRIDAGASWCWRAALPGMAGPTRACPRSPVPSRARTGTALASLGCVIGHERHDEEGAGSGSALRDLHPCLNRARARAGVQLARQPARGIRGLH